LFIFLGTNIQVIVFNQKIEKRLLHIKFKAWSKR
jgi:hypothetical protein